VLPSATNAVTRSMMESAYSNLFCDVLSLKPVYIWNEKLNRQFLDKCCYLSRMYTCIDTDVTMSNSYQVLGVLVLLLQQGELRLQRTELHLVGVEKCLNNIRVHKCRLK
jgi:hypothetical protein